ncbi:MAG TPA: PH domain-containing protein [Acidimicrobiia bacterium]|nr:PH domain-containing protein [Acidimicrobiia bacterium]
MGFPPRLLNEGEEIAYDLRPHWWFFAKEVGLGVLVVAVLLGVLQLHGDIQDLGMFFFAAVAVVWSLWVIWRLLVWMNTHFVVTTDRLIFRSGVFSRHGREIPLERVNDLTFHQSLWERIIGAGDLMIESAGEQGQQRFSDIPEPEAVQQEIYRQIEANVQRTARGDVAREATIPEQIAQLADLRDRGVLSEAEFESKKRDLLERM